MTLPGILGRLVAARGNDRQLAGYVAVQAGIRRAADDWISVERVPAFTALAAELGLVTEIDCVFAAADRAGPIRGIDRVPTTRALGLPYREGASYPPGAEVHVFVSSRRDWAAEACAAGWYPLAIGQRVIHKPRIDHVRLGLAFGYPACCVDFFFHFNDWPRWNTLAEATFRSTSLDWRTNCLTKHGRWMCLFHMPCSWSCPSTVTQATAVLDELRRIDGLYAAEVETRLHETYLVVSEVLVYRLVGARRRSGAWEFTAAEYAGGHPEHDRLSPALAGGGVLSLDAGLIVVDRGGDVELLETHCDRGAIEVPLILSFGEGKIDGVISTRCNGGPASHAPPRRDCSRGNRRSAGLAPL